jgi:hypothetical protein
MRDILLAAGLVLAAPTAAAQEIARLPDGRPDLQGVWTMRTLTPFERPDGITQASVGAADEAAMIALIMKQRLAGERFDPGTSEPDGEGLALVNGEYRTSAIVQPADGRLALTPEGKARLREKPDGYDGPEARPVNERCIADAGRAPYRVMSGEMFFEIIETPDHLVIRKEGMDPPRIFPRVGTGENTRFPSWTGTSEGRWDGDAFVIETTGFRDDDPNRRISGPGSSGFPVLPDTRMTEWLIPLSADTILYRYEIADPRLYVEPLVVELPMQRTREHLFESSCHEGNYSLGNTLLGARQREGRAP